MENNLPFTYRPKRFAGKLYLVIILFLVIGLLELFASRLQADILSAVRAYVEGEGLWSKAQKNGMQNLLRYAATHDEVYYRAFLNDLSTQQGDMQARLELQKPQPDLERAYEGFIAGGNHPGDVEGMVWLFLNFHDIPYLARAIEIWTEGDRETEQLRLLAERLHNDIASGINDAQRASQLLHELEQSNQRLTLLESHFSATLGEAARWVTEASTVLHLLFMSLLLAGGTLLSWRLVRNARDAEQGLAQSEAQFRRLADSDIISVGFWNTDGLVIDANDAFLSMMRFSRSDLTERKVNWRSFTSPEHQEKADKALAELAVRGVCTPFETEWIRSDGTYIPILVGAALLEGRAKWGVAYAQDLSQLKHTEEELRLSAKVIEQSSEAIIIADASNRILRVNRAFSEITGYSAAEVTGKNPFMFKSGRHDTEFYSEMWQQLNTRGYWRGEIWERRKSGEIYPKWLNINAIKNTKNEVSHYAAIFSDITSQKEYQEKLEHSAHYDALTGLPNRVLLADRLQQAMAQAHRYGHRLMLIYLDLDGFKAINDTHGHEVGDRLLVALAARMKQTLRESDTLARLGGDEFVGILNHLADEKGSLPKLANLLAVAAQPVHVGELVLKVSASIGVSFYPQTEEIDPDQLLRQADQAMYQAKLAGKNRFHIFDAEHDRNVRGHHESLERIQHALNASEFVLHYQPKVNMRTGQLTGVEALVRWQHPQRGLLPPGTFLPLIGDHSLALEVDKWVLDRALAQIELWHEAGSDISVSVNVSANFLQQPDFVESLSELLQAHPNAKPNDLVLEVLESSALQDLEHVSRVIRSCGEMGVDFALDDFGTGYSSLTYLKRLPAAQLKIDQSFVRDMLDDPEAMAIVEGVLGLATSFRRSAIAEGVETEAHGALLLGLGCEVAQGNLISKPMPAEAVLEWIDGWCPPQSWTNQRDLQPEAMLSVCAAKKHHG